MLLTITTSYTPATDLGYLLHKHPARCQTFKLAFGEAHVFYPEADAARCTAALLLDVDPVALVRRRGAAAMTQYVNDRPYVASSLLSVALARVYGTALAGRCNDRPELVETAIPLEARLAVVPCRGGEAMLQRLFEPLGYTVAAARHTLDEAFPDWGESTYFTVTLSAAKRLADLLTHLYVLIPVLDDTKHYWVGEDEVEKLLHRGEGWLAAHPEHALITRRYLKRRQSLVRQALAHLVAEEPEPDEQAQDREEEAVEKPISLHEQRLEAVLATLKEFGARRVLDLGCGEGKLLRHLFKDPSFEEIVGLDVSHRALERARERLRLDRLPERQQARIRLLHGSLIYRDRRLAAFDAAAVVEVIEHLDPPRLAAFERVVFEHARPGAVVVTTPNQEYNALFETMPAGAFRHRDHRFEWTRAEFQDWAQQVAERHAYTVRFAPIGPEDPKRGAPTQMGVFVEA